MFGHIIINKSELKIKEFDKYRSYYCGLCNQLKKSYGMPGQMSLTYDMAFLVLLLTGLYEPINEEGYRRCAAHPLEKHKTLENEYSAYAADMNMLLSYLKCDDDWRDDKKILKLAYGKILKSKSKAMFIQYQEKIDMIISLMKELSDEEAKNNTDIDYMSGVFGKILGEVFVCKKDEWESEVRKIGYYLGKFIYLSDAYEDIEDDVKSGNYNPLKEVYKTESFENDCEEMLTIMISKCCQEFEKLPILEDADIMRNILYSGVWYCYNTAKEKREQGEKQ
ncbi:MAG: DUF5685 family protein [Suipraeoptans sp.]